MRALLATAVVAAVMSVAEAKPLRAVSFGPLATDVCEVEATGAVRCVHDYKLPADLEARDVAIAYALYVVDKAGKVFAWDPYEPKLEPIAVPFTVREIELVESKLCAIGDHGELACGDPKNKKLEVVAAPAKTSFRLAAADGDSLWLLDEHDALWCLGERNCARIYAASKKLAANTPLRDAAWSKAYPNEVDGGAPADAPLWRVTDSVKRVVPDGAGDACIERTKDAGTLTCWGFTQSPTARALPKADELVSAGNYLCARTKDAISCRWDSPFDHKPRVNSFTLKNAVRMHVWDTRFCVETSDGALSCTEVSSEKWHALEPVQWATR